MTQPKKQKKEEAPDPFAIVKQYLLDCPHLPADHPVIKAALDGLEKEEMRQARDAKLQRKFAQSTTVSSRNDEATTTTTTTTTTKSSNSDGVLVMAPPSDAAADDDHDADADAAMESEWQDVGDTVADSKPIPHDNGAAVGAAAATTDESLSSSFLGRELSKTAIDKISEHRIMVSNPLSAIALVIHAALRSDILGFACTGIPEATTSAFAAPVRELPKSQFVPPRWDSNANNGKLIQLRYRKDGTGALKLMVQLQTSADEDRVQIQLAPANSQEPPNETLSFALSDHINMDSWKAATAKTKKIAPALHFKFLPVLLTKFCQVYDLGSTDVGAVGGDPALSAVSSSIPYVDNTIAHSRAQALPSSSSSSSPSSSIPTPPTVPVAASVHRQPHHLDSVPSTLEQAFPPIAVGTNQGHFAGDLAPAGLRDPLRIGSGRMGGNQMGPNHPHFVGGGGMGMGPAGMFPGGGGSGGLGTMQPRFDPVLPPGVDIDFDGGHRRQPPPSRHNRPSRTGQPNPDHLRPPNSFAGDSMFM